MEEPNGTRALLLQEKYWKNPLVQSQKVKISVVPTCMKEYQGRSWIRIKDLYWNGEEILSFFVFESKRIGYQDDISVFRYACRKGIEIEVSLQKLEPGLWSLHLLC